MCVNEQALYFMVVMTITRPDLVNKLCVLVFTSLYACGNSTGSLLLPLPLFSKPVPPQTHLEEACSACSKHKTP